MSELVPANKTVPPEESVPPDEPHSSLTIACCGGRAAAKEACPSTLPPGQVQLEDIEMGAIQQQEQDEEFRERIKAAKECGCDTCLSDEEALSIQQTKLATEKEKLYEHWRSSLGGVKKQEPTSISAALEHSKDVMSCINPEMEFGLRIYQCEMWEYIVRVRPLLNWPFGLSFGPIMYKLPGSEKWMKYTLGFGDRTSPGFIGLDNLCQSIIVELFPR